MLTLNQKNPEKMMTKPPFNQYSNKSIYISLHSVLWYDFWNKFHYLIRKWKLQFMSLLIIHTVKIIDRKLDFVGNCMTESTVYFFRYYPKFYFQTYDWNQNSSIISIFSSAHCKWFSTIIIKTLIELIQNNSMSKLQIKGHNMTN